MLTSVYQPMVGAKAISLYFVLCQQIATEQVGWSQAEQQRKLFLALDVELNEAGRKMLVECTSRLEAIGLMETYRMHVIEEDDFMYSYVLQPPLSPHEFFKTQHLVLLLRDKIGKHMVLSLREQFFSPMPEAGDHSVRENISVPFYHLFELNTLAYDTELEEAFEHWQHETMQSSSAQAENKLESISYTDIISRFPKHSSNRQYVERLRLESDQLATVNYMAKKYHLSLQDVCRLLDEDDLFDLDGRLLQEVLQYKANLHFRQHRKREAQRSRYLHKAVTEGEETEHTDTTATAKQVQMEFYLEVPQRLAKDFDVPGYNLFLRNETYTHVLGKYFPGNIPEHALNIFEHIDINYKLKEEVINVLIHYLFYYQLSWNKNFIDSIAADLLGKQIDSFEKAVQYIRQQAAYKAKADKQPASRKGGKNGSPARKPRIPIVQHQPDEVSVTEEEYQNILKKYKLADES